MFFLFRQLLNKSNGEKYMWKGRDNLKLQQPQAELFLEEVLILINWQSFSVTSEFTEVAYSNERAFFIDQETAGGLSWKQKLFFLYIILPNSGFILGIPMWHYEMALNPDVLKRGGVIPHYPIEPDIENI